MAYDRGFNSIAIMHVDTKYNIYFLVWCSSFSHCNFFNSPIICQQAHMCAKIVKLLDKKVWRGGKVLNKGGGEALVKVNNHRYLA